MRGVAACVWRLRLLNGTIDNVAYSHCLGRLRLIVAEPGAAPEAWRAGLPWDAVGLEGAYGLERHTGWPSGATTWSYRRAFASYLGSEAKAACAAHHHPFGEELERKFKAAAETAACYVAATVRARWVAPGAYAMELPLPESGLCAASR